MDGIAHEQRRRLETTKAELVGVKRRLEQLYDLAEIADLDSLGSASATGRKRLPPGRGCREDDSRIRTGHDNMTIPSAWSTTCHDRTGPTR